MAIISGPQRWWIDSNPTFAAKQAVVQDNLLLNLDAGVSSSYSGSGSTWYNLTTGNNATRVGPTYSSSVGNGSFLFDGYNDRFTCGTFTGFNNTVTLEAWLRFTSMTADDGDDMFIIQGGGSSLTFDFRTRTTQTGQLIERKGEFRIGGGAAGTTQTINGLSTGTWYHFAGTYDGSTLRFYLNNILQGTKSYTDYFSNVSVELGRYAYTNAPDQDALQFNGYLSTVRIYNKALTATEVSQNFNVYKARFGL